MGPAPQDPQTLHIPPAAGSGALCHSSWCLPDRHTARPTTALPLTVSRDAEPDGEAGTCSRTSGAAAQASTRDSELEFSGLEKYTCQNSRS